MAHILIVDDEVSIQLLIRTMLESAGHSVYEARDGRVALDILKTDTNPFDLIVLDVRMPKMDGFEFLSILQNQPLRLPVLILSAHVDRIPPTLESLVSGYLLKPFRRQGLLEAVNNLLGKRILRRSTEKVTEHSLNDVGDD